MKVDLNFLVFAVSGISLAQVIDQVKLNYH